MCFQQKMWKKMMVPLLLTMTLSALPSSAAFVTNPFTVIKQATPGPHLCPLRALPSMREKASVLSVNMVLQSPQESSAEVVKRALADVRTNLEAGWDNFKLRVENGSATVNAWTDTTQKEIQTFQSSVTRNFDKTVQDVQSQATHVRGEVFSSISAFQDNAESRLKELEGEIRATLQKIMEDAEIQQNVQRTKLRTSAGKLRDEVETLRQSALDSIENYQSEAKSLVTDLESTLKAKFDSFENSLKSQLDDVKTQTFTFANNAQDQFANVKDELSSSAESFQNELTLKVDTFATSLSDTVQSWKSDALSAAGNVQSTVSKFVDEKAGVLAQLRDELDGVVDSQVAKLDTFVAPTEEVPGEPGESSEAPDSQDRSP